MSQEKPKVITPDQLNYLARAFETEGIMGRDLLQVKQRELEIQASFTRLRKERQTLLAQIAKQLGFDPAVGISVNLQTGEVFPRGQEPNDG